MMMRWCDRWIFISQQADKHTNDDPFYVSYCTTQYHTNHQNVPYSVSKIINQTIPSLHYPTQLYCTLHLLHTSCSSFIPTYQNYVFSKTTYFSCVDQSPLDTRLTYCTYRTYTNRGPNRSHHNNKLRVYDDCHTTSID